VNIVAHLNWFDFVIIAIIILSIVISFFRGFLREAVSLVTWVLALIIALKFALPFSHLLPAFIHSNTLRYLLSFMVLFLSVFTVGFIVNVIVKRLVDVTGLTIVDRMLGILFGTARGLIAVGVILMFISVTSMQNTAWAKTSQLAPEISPLVGWLDGFLPEQMQDVTQWVIGKPQK